MTKEILEQLEVAHQAVRQLMKLTDPSECGLFEHTDAYELLWFRDAIEDEIRQFLKKKEEVKLFEYLTDVNNRAQDKLRLQVINQTAQRVCPELYSKWQKLTLIS
jgi:hypothetical protein